jgi:hypothetical protein
MFGTPPERLLRNDFVSNAGVVIGSGGVLYGTTLTGGSCVDDLGGSVCGTVFS